MGIVAIVLALIVAAILLFITWTIIDWVLDRFWPATKPSPTFDPDAAHPEPRRAGGGP